ncbi:MAG: CotH kinase family protein [Bacteroidales bacterium]|nr:CotH kinase family protein [Bacteroidales bacterium]
MALTDNEFKKIVDEVKAQLKSESTGVNEIETVNSLTGVQLLPSMKGDKFVLAPVSLLSQPAIEAANLANLAAGAANTAKDNATLAAGTAQTARQLALEAAENANAATETANHLIENFDVKIASVSSLLIIDYFTEGNVDVKDEHIENAGMVVFLTDSSSIVFRVDTPSGSLYFKDWKGKEAYTYEDNSPRRDKVFLYNGSIYLWNDFKMIRQVNILDLIDLEEELTNQNPFFNVTERVPLASGYYTLENALKAVPVDIRKKGLVITYQTEENKWETKQFTGIYPKNWSIADDWKDFGKGGGGAVINVTTQFPLESGFYTLQSAVEAIETAKEKALGMVLTFASEPSKWLSYQYTGTSIETQAWKTLDLWEEYGGGGSIKTISINANGKISPDTEGNVNINLEIPEVDETLDPESTNTIQNKAVTAKIAELETSTLFGSEVEVDEENNTVKVSLTNKSGSAITEFEIPAGSGGGSSEVAATKIILSAAVDKPTIKEGDSVILSYSFDHQYTTGEEAGISTGQKATLEISMKRGSTLVYLQTLQDVSKGDYTLDVSKYLTLGTTDIYVKAVTSDPTTGNSQRKQAYQSVRTLNLSLSSSYNLANNIAGYQSSDTLTVPFSITGTGNKVVTLFIDGVQEYTQTVTRSGQTNSAFSVPLSILKNGRHTIQMVAELEAAEDLTIRSESIYFDILKRGNEEVIRFIGTKMSFRDGRIFDAANHLTPRLETGQYESLEFEFVAYDSTKNPTYVEVYRDGAKNQTISVARTTQLYTNRFSEEGEVRMKLVCEKTEYPFFIDVNPSDIDIEEVSTDVVLRLVAAGRSNTEENPASWEYENISTLFNGFDWKSNGWTGDVLRLTNGANIEIAYKPFASDPTSRGATYEIELECSNVSDRTATVIDCMNQNVGFKMTTQEAILRSLGGVEVNTLFAPMNIKVAFVIRNKENHCLMELYVNGIRCGAAQYSNSDSFMQPEPSNIRINSEYADVDIRAIRVYNRALNDDEVLNNYIVDRPTGEEMVVLFNNNDIASEDGITSVDMDKIRLQGKSVMRIVGNVNLVNQTNDKKFEVPVDVYFYSAYGKEYDFVAKNIGLRIQGTSSTTYPRKNYRLYFDRGSKYDNCTLEVNGVNVPDFNYSFKPGARPVSIFCMKADFAESSSTHNTGAASLMNDVWKKCGFLTPPQKNNASPYEVRVAIDGFPCDMWYDNDGSNLNVYLGKYNFNNEKSGSSVVYGFEGIQGFNDGMALNGERNKCICLEFLNNSEPLCLFTSDDMTRFDDALEFRYKEDIKWSTAHEDDKAAIQRLWSWIVSRKNNPNAFVEEVTQYFNVDNLCAWYLYTEYFMACDQRAKNMMLATWDGLEWYFLPYDCDTILGVRNDGVLKYDYTIDYKTIDESIKSHAFAGYDSVLWDLVRKGLYDKLASVADSFRKNMPVNDVLDKFNNQQMENWSERIYNKDGEYKYILPLTEGVDMPDGKKYYNYLYSLQGSRYAHRTFIIQNRFALLDAQYVVGTYRSDAFTAYFGYDFSLNPRRIKIVASEKYFFGYGYTSGAPTLSAVPAAGKGSVVYLPLSSKLIVNDPQNFYGASRILELDLSTVSMALVQTLNLNNCTALKKLDVSYPQTQTSLNNILITNCRGLEDLNITGLKSPNFTSIDISKNARLKRFIASNTSLTGVSFAPGAPLEEAVLPATIQSLELRSLNKLQLSGLTLQSPGTITRLVVEYCDLLDWEELLQKCYNVRYLRVTGIDMTGDTAFLDKYMKMGGIDENGANTNTCRLVGNYQLTNYVEEDKLATYQEHYPELNIKQPEYTCIEFDDTVADPANISNLDNKTGYKFGNEYKPSGHISKILSMRHRVLGKKTAEGEVSIFPLHDDNSNYYADSKYLESASPALLTGQEGNVWVYEPHYWYKGINDIINGKKYAFFSSNESVKQPEGEKILMRDLTIVNGFALRLNQPTLEASIQINSTNSYGIINLKGYKRVRVPGIASAVYGALFLDNSDKVINSFFGSSENGMIDGMYIFSDVPENATKIAFTFSTLIENGFVWLTNSKEIPDIEPDWVLHEECLGGVYNALIEDGIMRTKSQVKATVNLQIDTTRSCAENMGIGYRIFDYTLRKDIVNLAMAKYGTRESIFGWIKDGNVLNGRTNDCGMEDTIDLIHIPTNVNKRADNTLGYENFISNQLNLTEGLQWVAGHFIFNDREGNSKNHPFPPSSLADNDNWILNVYHGKEMDITPVRIGGTSTTYYPASFRPAYNGNAVFGTGQATSASSSGFFHQHYHYYNTAAYLSGRIMFIGAIKFINSVCEYKQLQKLD